MTRIIGLVAIAALITLASVSISTEPANAVVYCKTVGVPKGCVVRPVAACRYVVVNGVRVRRCV
jgi:hypothetical protein